MEYVDFLNIEQIYYWIYLIIKGLFYYFNPIFETLSGILPTDKWHQTNQQMLIKKSAFEKSSEIIIPKGTPLATYIPFKREEYKYVISPQTEKLLKDDLYKILEF